MKKTKLIFLLIASCYSMMPANAIIVQKIELKNGSILEGYISMQRPGKDFVFNSDRATMILSGENIKSIVEHEQNETALSKEWVDWGNQNNALTVLGNNKQLLLSDIITDKGEINHVRILQKGAVVKYLEVTKNKTYTFNWDTIVSVQVEKRAQTILSGLNRSYELTSGEKHEGQYIQELPGKTITLYNNGINVVFNSLQVAGYKVEKNNPNQDLLEQSQLLDELLLKGGEVASGIIIEQNYSKADQSSPFLVIQNENGYSRSIKLEDITEYRKKVNPKYKEIQDIILNAGDIYINRIKAYSSKYSTSSGGLGITFTADSNTILIKKNAPATEIVVESRLMKNMPQQQSFILVRSNQIKEKKGTSYEVTYENIVKSQIVPVRTETTINNTLKSVYSLPQAGMYVIYNSGEKTIMPIEVK